MLDEFGLLKEVLPEISTLRTTSAWGRIVKELRAMAAQIPVPSPTLAWATLFLELGPAPGGVGPSLPREIAERLKMSREEIERIGLLIDGNGKFRDAFKMREATLERFLREPGFEEQLMLHRIDATVSDGNLAFYEFCHSRWQSIRESTVAELPKLIDGTDLIQLGLKPGPEFSEILRVVEDLVLERKLATKEEALEYVVRYFVR